MKIYYILIAFLLLLILLLNKEIWAGIQSLLRATFKDSAKFSFRVSLFNSLILIAIMPIIFMTIGINLNYIVLFFISLWAAIVFWRTYADATRLLLNNRSIVYPTIEGFCAAAAPPITFFIIDLAPLAYAGIPFHLEAKHFTFSEWFQVFVREFILASKFGFFGALAGFGFGAIDRKLIMFCNKTI